MTTPPKTFYAIRADHGGIAIIFGDMELEPAIKRTPGYQSFDNQGPFTAANSYDAWKIAQGFEWAREMVQGVMSL